MSTLTLDAISPDLEDGELPSSDEETCDNGDNIKKDDTSLGNSEKKKRGSNSVSSDNSSTFTKADNESTVKPFNDTESSDSVRKRPFESPEPEDSEEVSSKVCLYMCIYMCSLIHVHVY